MSVELKDGADVNEIGFDFNHICRYQGYLLKKRKVGFQSFFVVLYRGNLIYYKNGVDAENDFNRRRTYSLSKAIVNESVKFKYNMSYSGYSFSVRFRSGRTHSLLAFPVDKKGAIKMSIPAIHKFKHGGTFEASDRKNKWIKAFREHIEYASKIEDLEKLGKMLNIQIGSIEKQLMFFKNKLDVIQRTGGVRGDYERSFESSLGESHQDTDSQLGTSLNESFDTAEEFDSDDDEDEVDELSDIDENDSSKIIKPKKLSQDSDIFFIDLKTWRDRLPYEMIDRAQISIWSIAKQLIGKELTRLTIPAALCEPLSFLQRVGESLQYSRLLTKAVRCEHDPCRRMELVAAFVFSLVGCIERMAIPFNPALGETYELVREDLGFRMIAEQVSIQPPSCAYYSESLDADAKWTVSGFMSARYKFWGRSVELDPRGLVIIEFPELNETYSYKASPYCIHSVILGPSWIEHYENVEITCAQSGYKAVLNFKPTTSHKQNHRYDGFVYNNEMKRVKAVYGEWLKNFYSCDASSYEHYILTNKNLPTHVSTLPKSPTEFNDLGHLRQSSVVLNGNGNDSNYQEASKSLRSKSNFPGSNGLELKKFDSIENMRPFSEFLSHSPLKDHVRIWTAFPDPPYMEKYYWFSYLAMSLNELTEELEKTLPPTDSRFRKDIRCLENRDIDGASKEKFRVEDRQRDAQKNREQRVLWFRAEKNPLVKDDAWVFTNEYWKRDFSKCPSLF